MRLRTAAVLLVLTAAAAVAGEPAALPACISPVPGSDFLAVQEFVLLDSLGDVPPGQTAQENSRSLAEFTAANGGTAPTGIQADDQVAARVVPCAGHWLLYRSYTTYVRRSAIVCLDEHPGAMHYMPQTPAVPGGSGIVPLPQSRGVTMVAGSGRIFCGVRSLGRSAAVGAGEGEAFALRVHAPDASAALSFLVPPPAH